jgi:hypothetical protein
MKRVAIVFACTVAVVIGCGAAPQPEAPVATETAEAAADQEHQIEFLFVHSAESATLADGVLRLGDVSPSTVYFSDRPDRVAGHLTTEEFVGNWGEGEDSFASNPPNATLSILEGDTPQEIVVVLTEPRLEDGDLIYNVQILEGAAAATGGGSSLFIDIIGRPLTPVSMAGVARRTTRWAVVW